MSFFASISVVQMTEPTVGSLNNEWNSISLPTTLPFNHIANLDALKRFAFIRVHISIIHIAFDVFCMKSTYNILCDLYGRYTLQMHVEVDFTFPPPSPPPLCTLCGPKKFLFAFLLNHKTSR